MNTREWLLDRRSSNYWIGSSLLICLGLLLRLGGLFQNGWADIDDEIILWGARVWHEGIGKTPIAFYGPASYVLFGLAYGMGELIPSFWWAPYKVLVFVFDFGIFVVLCFLVGRRYRRHIVLLYWLNPFVIVQGAWLGSWDAAYIFWAVLAPVCVWGFRSEAKGWFTAGLFLGLSAMFKPQATVFFISGLGLYGMFLGLFSRQWRPLIGLAFGVSSVVSILTIYIKLNGGSLLWLPQNYLGVMGAMPNLSNNSVNIWRPITRLLQYVLHQEGPTYAVVLPRGYNFALHTLSGLAIVILLIKFCLLLVKFVSRNRITHLDQSLRSLTVLAMMAFSSLVISQFGTRAHINHSFAALVLLLPLVLDESRLLWPWILSVLVHVYSELASYGLGRTTAIMNTSYLDLAPASSLKAALQGVKYDGTGISKIVKIKAYLNYEPAISILSLLQFAAAVWMVWVLFKMVSEEPTSDFPVVSRFLPSKEKPG